MDDAMLMMDPSLLVGNEAMKCTRWQDQNKSASRGEDEPYYITVRGVHAQMPGKSLPGGLMKPSGRHRKRYSSARP